MKTKVGKILVGMKAEDVDKLVNTGFNIKKTLTVQVTMGMGNNNAQHLYDYHRYELESFKEIVAKVHAVNVELNAPRKEVPFVRCADLICDGCPTFYGQHASKHIKTVVNPNPRLYEYKVVDPDGNEIIETNEILYTNF